MHIRLYHFRGTTALCALSCHLHSPQTRTLPFVLFVCPYLEHSLSCSLARLVAADMLGRSAPRAAPVLVGKACREAAANEL